MKDIGDTTVLLTIADRLSGLADPGPIASMFWLDDGLGSEIYLDGIVTLVDAKHIREVSPLFSLMCKEITQRTVHGRRKARDLDQ